jgi:hypothetical protein
MNIDMFDKQFKIGTSYMNYMELNGDTPNLLFLEYLQSKIILTNYKI